MQGLTLSERKLYLHAALGKIANKHELEESVLEAVSYLRNNASEHDFIAERISSGCLTDSADKLLEDLSCQKIGHYSCVFNYEKDRKTVSFKHSYYTLVFTFSRRNYSIADGLIEMIHKKQEISKEDLERYVLENIQRPIFGDDKALHPSEFSLGRQSQQLETYVIDKVEKVVSVPRHFLGRFGFTKFQWEKLYPC